MEGMSFQTILTELIDAGLTQSAIAKSVGASSPGQIWDLLSGRKVEPRYSLGKRIVELHRSVTRSRKKVA
jgi:predicted transcriptional regulator